MHKTFSWTGFRNNFRLESLTIMGIIKGVCRENFKTSDIEFETLVKHWFRHGAQRLARDELLSKNK
ncbi:putative histone-lysine N-methyltransferase 1, partial [Aphis craccivora]